MGLELLLVKQQQLLRKEECLSEWGVLVIWGLTRVAFSMSGSEYCSCPAGNVADCLSAGPFSTFSLPSSFKINIAPDEKLTLRYTGNLENALFTWGNPLSPITVPH